MSRGEIDRTISRTVNRRSFPIDRLVKIQQAISSSSTSTSVLVTKATTRVPDTTVNRCESTLNRSLYSASTLPLVVNTRHNLSQELPTPWPPSLQHNYHRPSPPVPDPISVATAASAYAALERPTSRQAHATSIHFSANTRSSHQNGLQTRILNSTSTKSFVKHAARPAHSVFQIIPRNILRSNLCRVFSEERFSRVTDLNSTTNHNLLRTE
jgi:hypothetical protein